MNNRRKGSIREHLAAAYLAEQGLEILEYNYRTARGEIDLVARDGDTYLFCECKWRAQPAGLAVLEDLVEKSQLFHTAKNYYAIFSKSGFHPELAKEARKRGDVLLYGMEELMGPGL